MKKFEVMNECYSFKEDVIMALEEISLIIERK